MTAETHMNWAERRASTRRQFYAKGWVRMPDGQKIAIKTFDASPQGLGAHHADSFPGAGGQPRGWLAMAGIDGNGKPYIFEAEVEVRHSVLSANGDIRSGLLFTQVSDENQLLLTRLLLDRPTM